MLKKSGIHALPAVPEKVPALAAGEAPSEDKQITVVRSLNLGSWQPNRTWGDEEKRITVMRRSKSLLLGRQEAGRGRCGSRPQQQQINREGVAAATDREGEAGRGEA